MIKQTIDYIDADGRACTEVFYFNLTKAEILEMEVSHAGGFSDSMQFLVDSKDNQGILRVIKELILKAYGERTDVSRHFVKKPEFAEAFSHTEAYSTLFMSLFQDATKAAAFFEGLMPADIVAQAKAEASNRPATQDYQRKQETPAPAFSVVKQSEGVEIQQPLATHDLDQTEYLALPREEQLAFLQGGGSIR